MAGIQMQEGGPALLQVRLPEAAAQDVGCLASTCLCIHTKHMRAMQGGGRPARPTSLLFRAHLHVRLSSGSSNSYCMPQVVWWSFGHLHLLVTCSPSSPTHTCVVVWRVPCRPGLPGAPAPTSPTTSLPACPLLLAADCWLLAAR